MKLAGWWLFALGLLVGCGDNGPAKGGSPQDATARPADAPPDAPSQLQCMASDQCTAPAAPTCCLFVSPGGAGQATCGAVTADANSCQYVACRGSADPCLTKAGAAGTCTEMSFGPSQTRYWVCE